MKEGATILGRPRLERSLATLALALIAGSALLRLWVSRALPITGDEAYHWVWTRHLDWGYYDHPPLTAWLIWLATRLFGEGLVAVRLVAVVSGAAAALALFALARRLFGSARAGLWSAALLIFAPVFAGLALLITTDPPLVASWALFLYLAWRAADDGRAHWWVLSGLALGLAILSKLIGLLLVPSFGLFLLFSRRHRRWLARPQPYLALLIGLAMTLPFLLWNAQHGWATFLFHLELRHEKRGLALDKFVLFWVGQLVVLSPLLFLALVGGAARAWRWRASAASGASALGQTSPLLRLPETQADHPLSARGEGKGGVRLSGRAQGDSPNSRQWNGARHDPRGLFLLCFALPLLFFTLSSLYTEVGAHWPAVGFLSLIVAASAPLGAGRWTAGYRRLRAWGLATAALMTALCFVLLASPGLVRHLVKPKTADKLLAEYAGWQELATRVARVKEEMSRAGPVFLTTPSYSLSSRLTYYLPGHPHVTVIGPGSPHGQNYAFWDDFEARLGEDALFVMKWSPDDRPEIMAYLQPAFARIEADAPVARRYRGRVVGHFYLLRCYRFRGITWQERLRPSRRP